MNRSVLWRAAAVQAVAVVLVSVALGAALPDSFFQRWGWLAGPAAWLVCAAVTATILRLALARTLLGAAIAGLPSVGAVVAGVHWLGPAVGIVIFALWCAWSAAPGAGADGRPLAGRAP